MSHQADAAITAGRRLQFLRALAIRPEHRSTRTRFLLDRSRSIRTRRR